MMKLFLLTSSTILPLLSSAFTFQQQQRATVVELQRQQQPLFSSTFDEYKYESNSHGGDDFDLLEKAQDVSTNFGKYSYEEIELLRDDLHDHRLQQMIARERGDIWKATKIDELTLEQYLEDDLSSQLEMLQGKLSDEAGTGSESSSSSLFLDSYDDVVPTATTSSTAAAVAVPSVITDTTTSEQQQEVKGLSSFSNNVFNNLLDAKRKAELMEGVMESIVVCGILGVLMMIDLLYLDGYIDNVPGQLIGFIE